MKVKVKYDLESDGELLTIEQAGVKEIMEVPNNINEDEISDWISDKTGWCVFSWEKIKTYRIEDVIIKFKCKYCKTTTEMTVVDLMDLGDEGLPYCMCTGYRTDFDVTGVQMKG